jgi:4-hydroxy-3-methylbut-2-enyl diphosphate reductase
MIIHKIEPQGYCGGVTHAIKMAMDAAKNDSISKPIYMLGQIIHNSHVISDLEKLGIITIEEKGLSRLILLDKINKGTVIFSAHGVSPLVYIKAKEKGLSIIDATCPYVLLVHNKIKEHLDLGYACIYIGTKNHPECEGVIGISDKIHFVSTIEDIKSLNIKNDKVYATNQTTLSIFETKIIFDEIKRIFPNSIIDDKICNATTVRQMATENLPDADLCIVVGDKKSSNTKKLYSVSIERGIKTILIEDLNSLPKESLIGVKKINISSGASTPSYIVDEIIDYLKRLEN